MREKVGGKGNIEGDKKLSLQELIAKQRDIVTFLPTVTMGLLAANIKEGKEIDPKKLAEEAFDLCICLSDEKESRLESLLLEYGYTKEQFRELVNVPNVY